MSRFVAYGIYKIIFTRINDQKSFELIHPGHNSPVKASNCGCLNYVKEKIKEEEICYQQKWIDKNIKICNFENVNKIIFKASNIKSFPFDNRKIIEYEFLNTPFFFADLDFDNIEEIILVSGPNNAGFAQKSNVYVYNFENDKSKFQLYKDAPLILGEIKEIDFNRKRIISVGDFRSRSEVIYKFLENSIQIFHDGYTMNGMKNENFLKTYIWPYVY
ncbi:hypothetical protein OA253_05475 [Alphaproteobacteria bacterium]|nr:hypothetical protein [Alphaproteobacteria bacterium]